LKDQLNEYPWHVQQYVKELNRRGYGVFVYNKDQPMSSAEIKGLADVVNEQVKRLRDKTAQVSQEFQRNMEEATDVVHLVDASSKALGTAVAQLKAALGVSTNSPPEGERLTDGK
jgi:hypothetical protein